MKILVEIDLPDIEPNDIYKPNSGWFNEPGNIDITEERLQQVWTENGSEFRFKYIGQVHDEIPRP